MVSYVWYHALLLCSFGIVLTRGQELRGSAVVAGGDLTGSRRRDLQLMSPPSGVLTGMQLIDSTKNVKVVDLVNGTVVFLDAIGMTKPTFNINVTYRGNDIGSVRIRSNVPGYTNIVEGVPAYALCGNIRSDFLQCPTLGAGTWYTLTATPFARSRARGAAGKSIAVSFVIYYANKTSYELKNLSYPYEAYEPYIDAATMNLHHSKHHGGAVTNLKKATENTTIKMPLVALTENALNVTGIRNNGGSHYNHALFWDHLAPFDKANKTKPSDQLLALLTSSFGGLEAMQLKFNAAAAPGALFGSGWVWLCVNPNVTPLRLEIVGTPNQDNPLMKGVVKNSAGVNQVMYPVLGLDVWEHAYYLKHQNRRPDFAATWWNVVDWDKVSNNTAYVIANGAGVNVQG